MSLFQSSVLKKYLKLQDNSSVDKAFNKYKKYFHNISIQENIRESKEEQFQEGFLRELFVNVFDYTLNPNPNFNLTTELKNETSSKKADGAILKDGLALAVIELKSTKTKDLESIRQQAFDYKANQTGCEYVITSNFEKVRFYIENAVEFEEFNLFSLNEKQFSLLYLCLHKDNILKNLPLKIKNDSIVEEESITKIFYEDYSLFKRELYRDLVKENVKNDVFRTELLKIDDINANKNIRLKLFKKSQKLIDRFLFIFFAEDRGLIPPNTTVEILDDWKKLGDLDAEAPLYSRFKLYFNYLHEGRKETEHKDEIFPYNGGLFYPDSILDSLILDDYLLYKHTKKLSDYDFDSQVDVNILGHIFENSLNEIESINAEIEGVEFDKQKTKRKKDGVFYTPKYITKYIVENTVGKICLEKKEEFGVKEDEYQKSKKGRKKETLVKLKDNLDNYRSWLLGITICDPACGSGAFLNQTLDFLIKEHHYLDELETSLLGGSIVFKNVENTILENNIYGVDINEESIEIARLSLWLRTAQPRRKLNNLSSNIKCGDSLIQSKNISNDKAFNWESEFPDVFEKGGFDIIIGNPPYVTRGLSNNIKKALNTLFQTAQYQLDLYVAFIERGVNLLKDYGHLSYIVPNSWLKNMMMSECRNFLLNNLDIQQIIPNLENVFTDASVDTMIFSGVKKDLGEKTDILEFRDKELYFRHTVSQSRFLTNDGYTFDVEVSQDILPIINKMSMDVIAVGNLFDVTRGINPYDKYTGQSPEVIKTRAYHSSFKKDDSFVPELKGLHVSRYNYNWDNKYFISYGDWLAAPRQIKYFEGERIVFREILGKTLVSTLITEDFKIDRSLYIAKLEESQKDLMDIKYILGILNSTLMAFYFRYTKNEFDNLFPKIRVAEFKALPIKIIDYKQQSIISSKVDIMLSLIKELNNTQSKFLRYIQSQYQFDKVSKKMNGWYELQFIDFMKELNKAIKKLGKEKITKSDEIEWMEVFDKNKIEALLLKSRIDKCDAEINHLVYELYGLTEKEIKIIIEA